MNINERPYTRTSTYLTIENTDNQIDFEIDNSSLTISLDDAPDELFHPTDDEPSTAAISFSLDQALRLRDFLNFALPL